MFLRNISRVLLILSTFYPDIALADLTSIIRSMVVDKLELEVQVQDPQGKPLVGALIWYFEKPLDNGFTLDSASRMMHRYANQSDFLDNMDFAVFRHTNKAGIYFNYREMSGINGNYPYIFVVTKRGYQPQVVEGSAPLNRNHVVLFKLQPDPTAHIDPRMEAFDQIMAQARDNSPDQNYMGEARMHKLEQLEQELRQLAQGLEADGLNNEASAVYWALADFPSVTRMTTADGQQKITGYANGRTGPAAEADRLKATELNTTVPKLLINKMMMQQGFPRQGINNEKQGKAYLSIFEQLITGSQKEQVLPVEYKIAIWQAIRWSTPDKSCELLQKAYVFEPATMPLKDWWARIKDVERQRQRLNMTIAAQCVIPGLPPMSKNNRN